MTQHRSPPTGNSIRSQHYRSIHIKLCRVQWVVIISNARNVSKIITV